MLGNTRGGLHRRRSASYAYFSSFADAVDPFPDVLVYVGGQHSVASRQLALAAAREARTYPMEVPLQIREIGTASRQLAEVFEIYRLNRRYLGFLPDAGFVDRAKQGTLLGAVQNEHAVVGYVLYDLPGDAVKIVHLCVSRIARQGGIARALIERVDERHPERRCIQLSCRRDFPANELWPRLGFSPLGERVGRSRAGHPLTIWQRAHDHADLFTLPDERREIAAIDCNIFKDLTSSRPQGRPSRRLHDDWIQELVDLRVTDELFHEINRCEDRELRKAMQRDASAFSRLPSVNGNWQRLVAPVAELASAAGNADHRQVARAIAADARYFVTRDGELLGATDAIAEAFGLLIIRPEDLIVRLDRSRYSGDYEPQALHATSVTQLRVDQVDQRNLVTAFLNYGAGERASALRDLVRTALAAPHEHELRVFADANKKLVGMVILRTSETRLEVSLMRTRGSDRLGVAVARQLAFLPRREAADRQLPHVLVKDGALTATVRRALSEEYFRDTGNGWVCEVGRGLVESPAQRSVLSGPSRAAQVERRRWPEKLVAGPPTFMISIHPTYAAQLFESNLAAGTLFGRELALGLSREHVYYRGCGWSGGLLAPARVLWYVKGTDQTGPGYLAAVSALVEVARGRPRTLHQRFARLGVWSRQEIEAAARNRNEVMALRFADTELFVKPPALQELREIYASAGLVFRAPQSPTLVPEHMFCLLYRRASAYAV